ncbi:MBL fold metallo-hydrolase [Patescibacteria group bacterium]|nr:MBL fold metallo-hydrolase [Patescibacteria group bacterium]
MEITYIGHSCFKIKDKTITMVIDPYDPKIGYKLPKLSCDVLLTTHDHFDHNYIEGVSDYRLLIDGPGEYEIGGCFIYGRAVGHDEKGGAERGKVTMYLITIDGFNILHVGDLGCELSQEDMEKIPSVDVLMIPVGGKYTIDAEKATKVISSLEPSYVIPMHYKTKDLTGVEGLSGVEEFLDEMGVENGVKKDVDKLVINSKSDLDGETQVIVLKPAH